MVANQSPKKFKNMFEVAKNPLSLIMNSGPLPWMGIGIPLLGFQQLATQVGQNPQVLNWDTSILLAIHETRGTELDRLATTLTHLGSLWILLPVTLAIALVYGWQQQWRFAAYIIVAELSNGLLNAIAKGWMHRLRPQLWESIYHPVTDYAFPSGHAMSSMTFAAALVILTWGTRWQGWAIALGSLWVVIVGWTRLYLGVHFPSDILGGWILGIAWSCLLAQFFQIHQHQAIEDSEPAS